MILHSNNTTVKSLACSTYDDGVRVDTLQLRYPRIIHSEMMTHRQFSRNASSSRAIPTVTILNRDADIFVPAFRYNQTGMQPAAYVNERDQIAASEIWREMAAFVAEKCRILAAKDGLNIAKQWTNRPLEWFGYIDVVVSSTDWANFDALRDHHMAQDEIAILCRAMKDARESAVPVLLKEGEWHMPYITDADRAEASRDVMKYTHLIHDVLPDTDAVPNLSYTEALLLIASAARACRASYSKLDGSQTTFAEDIERFRKLIPKNDPVHATPLEHQCTPQKDYCSNIHGNLRGYMQFRKIIPNEAVFDR